MTEIPDDVMKAAYDAALDYRNDKACDPIHNDDALCQSNPRYKGAGIMSSAKRKVKVEGPGALKVFKRGQGDDRQFSVQNDHQRAAGEWDDVYVEFSGYFGSYGPHVFAAAPDLLKVLKRIDAAMDFNGTCHPLFNGLQKQMQDAIAKAEGRS